MRVIYDRKKFEVASEHHSTTDLWDDLAGRANGPGKDRINRCLSELESKVYRVKERLEIESKTVSSKNIKKALFGRDNFGAPNKRLLDYFSEYIEKLEKRGKLDEETLKTYRTSLHRHLKNYLSYADKTNFLVNDLSLKFVRDYDEYLRSVALTPRLTKLKSATVKKQHEKLSALSKEAIYDGYIDSNPYASLSFSKKNDEVVPLNWYELTIIKEAELPERLDRVRDIFIFSCFSGLRYSDASALTMDMVTESKSGNFYLHIDKQEKTSKPGNVPLFMEAVKILRKYELSPERKVLNLALPKISNQKVNKFLKEIGNQLGIKKHMTHKLARHTFATTVLQDIPAEEAQFLLMHADIKSTLVYKKVTVEQLEKSIRNIEETRS
ncbi:tyrosine-type recombinase/integrase [Catalinimonas niigatensis]|uniref:tyrosine-type recombinase/integrase n=1 Tax=Catalinimonas niigatensis TaxID=1397264 RepID=UPI002664F48A|nr:site-specific integrase [Catalinimonas niigatensis]WPP47959.1 site-specific integrase [Catalinimonas niigatensis]